MANQTDKIFTLLKSDHKAAFKYLYQEYFSMIQYFVTKNSGTKEDAEDVFQDCLVVLYEKSVSGDFALNCTIKTFIYSISRNLWLKEIRDNRKRINVKDYEQFIEVNNHAVEFAEKDNRMKHVRSAIDKLGDKCRKILESFYFSNKKMNVIASEMGYTNADNAKNQKYKCMQQLKKLTIQMVQNG